MFTALDIVLEDHKLYHRTDAVIGKLDEKFLEIETRWHSNGSMGLWCSTLPNFCEPFGQNCYEVVFKDSIKRVGWEFGQFFKFCRDRLDRFAYQDLREYCLGAGIDVIYLVEYRPHINEVIVINYDAVDRLDLVSPPKDKTYKLIARGIHE